MTLIPMIWSALSPRAATLETAGGGALAMRGSYNPGAGHRPLAAVLAIGVPAALVVAVALSPMMIAIIDKPDTTIIRSIPLPKPPEPATTPEPQTQAQPQSTLTTIPSPLPPVAQDAPVVKVPEVHFAPAGTGTGPVAADPVVEAAPPAKLLAARLDRKYMAGFQPDYPLREEKEGIEGTARVRVLIGTDGRVKAVELVRSDSPGFFEATKRRALAKWRFNPATRGGVAEESWMEMTVRFQIRDA